VVSLLARVELERLAMARQEERQRIRAQDERRLLVHRDARASAV
jgi:hypothetical protein